MLASNKIDKKSDLENALIAAKDQFFSVSAYLALYL